MTQWWFEFRTYNATASPCDAVALNSTRHPQLPRLQTWVLNIRNNRNQHWRLCCLVTFWPLSPCLERFGNVLWSLSCCSTVSMCVLPCSVTCVDCAVLRSVTVCWLGAVLCCSGIWFWEVQSSSWPPIRHSPQQGEAESRADFHWSTVFFLVATSVCLPHLSLSFYN